MGGTVTVLQQVGATWPPVLAQSTAPQGFAFLLHSFHDVDCQQDSAPPDRSSRALTPLCSTSTPCWGDESQARLHLMSPLASCYFFPLWGQGPSQSPPCLCVVEPSTSHQCSACSGGPQRDRETFHSSLLKPLGMLHWDGGKKGEGGKRAA